MFIGFWKSLKARFFVFSCGLVFMVTGFIAHPEDSRQALEKAEEWLRKIYYGESA